MQLEAYLDFQSENDIRLVGTRVGVETVLFAYLDEKQTAEEIAANYPAISLEQIYATILYYLHYREKMDIYLEAFVADSRCRQDLQDIHPTPIVRRLKEASGSRRFPDAQ